MFLRLVADSFGRRPRRKLLTGAALALGMAVVTAAFSVSLDVGDRLSHEFRSLGANLLVTPQADSLPLQIGGVDYRPVNSGAYLPEQDLGKIKTIFWRNNIVGFAPVMEVPAEVSTASMRLRFRGAKPRWSEPGRNIPSHFPMAASTQPEWIKPIPGGTLTAGGSTTMLPKQ